MGRVLGISHTTVARYIGRLSRHCLLFHQNLNQNQKIEEPQPS